MKNLIRTVTVTLLLLSTLGCEEKIDRSKDTTFYNLIGPVQSVVHTFDYSNKSDNNKDSYAPGKLKIEFNQGGMLLNILQQYTDQTNPDAKPRVSSTTFNYDDKGKLESQINNFDFDLYSDNVQTLKYLYKDDSEHPYSSVSISKDDPQMNLLEHDERGNLISIKTMRKDSETHSTYSASFNEKNQPIMYQNTFMSDYKTTTSFTYNKDGFTNTRTIDIDDEKSVLTYEYLKTDDYGNWIERKVLSESDEGYIIERREISYY